MNPKLTDLLAKARATQVTEAERETQRVSFAYGNSNFENEHITRETVLHESERLKNEEGKPR